MTAATSHQPEPALNETVAGRYRLSHLIARGGMGEVFVAIDQSTQARVALKRMLGTDGAPVSRSVHFMREYHALTELRHPSIIEVYDYGVDNGLPFYTMELLDGQDLRDLSPVPYRDACRYLRDVASSLALLHARRLLHRDVSPRNVRRTGDGRCKLLDFGAMVPFGMPPNLTGTPPFIPPEAVQGGPLDQRADLYSLGALAYYVLTGRYAHPVGDVASLPRAWEMTPPSPGQLVADLPAALDELVMALLSMDALQRPASAAEVIERLSAAGELAPQNDPAIARSFLTGSQLVGRGAQRGIVRRHVVKAASGKGSALLIRADEGAGRSRMLAEAALIGQVNGLTVVRTVARAAGSGAALAQDLLRGISQAAPAEAARASAQRPQVTARSLDADSGEDRAHVVRELSELVREVAQARPLLITVDDLERADELSASLIAALGYLSSECPLSIVASCNSRYEPPLLAQVSNLAETIALPPLDPRHTLLLALSLFGEVPNLERLGDWLYRVAAGNPKLTVQLAEHLLAQGTVRYVDGTWVLPSELPQSLPPSAADALLLRVRGVSAEARALAELLCVSRASTTVERIVELADKPAAVVFGALDELVGAGILEGAGTAYAFAQEALRESLYGALDPERQRLLHSAWARCLLADKPTAEAKLEAGWHLVHTEAELRGADILAEIAPDWVERRVSMAVAVPAMERALEIYARHGRPLAQQLRLRSLLAMSSFLFDHRLAGRHAEAALDGLYPFTGLGWTERWSRTLGKRLAFLLALAWVSLRRLIQPRAARGPNVIDALRFYTRAAMGLVGLRALAIDVDGMRAAFERMRMFDGAPHPTLQLVHALAHAVSLHNQGRAADMEPILQGVLDRLDGKQRKPMQLSQAERVDLLTGALMLQGLNECYREHSQALSCAERLKELNTPIALAASLRVSMTYHLLRGDTVQTQHYRRLLELSAIQDGTVWQIDWIAAPLEGVSGVMWYDLVMLRRALDALEKMASEDARFSNMRDMLRVGYHFRRGDYAAAVRFGEEYIAAHAPFTLLGWASTYSQVALSQLELGNSERALAICENAAPLLTGRHQSYVIHYASLEATYATLLAVTGQRERGEIMLRTLTDRLHAAGEHTRAFQMHEFHVKIAKKLGDRAALRSALRAMRDAALASGNPNAILLAAAVSDRSARVDGIAADAPTTPSLISMSRSDETVAFAFLRAENQLERRAEHALYLLGQYASEGEAYLFWLKDDGLELAASLDKRAPPAALERMLSTLPANDVHTVSLLHDAAETYTVLRLVDSTKRCLGLAALRGVHSGNNRIPPALISDVGRALASGAGRE